MILRSFTLMILALFGTGAFAAPKIWVIEDPSFVARPGATAYFGEHAGSAYQFEVPAE